MNPAVLSQGIAAGKGFQTARRQTDKGPGSGMNPPVMLQGARVRKGFWAAVPRAGQPLFSGRHWWVSLAQPGLCEGALTARQRPGQGCGSGVKAPSAVGPVGGASGVPDLVMAGGRTSGIACSPAYDRNRFTGSRLMDGRHGCGEVRGRE